MANKHDIQVKIGADASDVSKTLEKLQQKLIELKKTSNANKIDIAQSRADEASITQRQKEDNFQQKRREQAAAYLEVRSARNNVGKAKERLESTNLDAAALMNEGNLLTDNPKVKKAQKQLNSAEREEAKANEALDKTINAEIRAAQKVVKENTRLATAIAAQEAATVKASQKANFSEKALKNAEKATSAYEKALEKLSNGGHLADIRTVRKAERDKQAVNDDNVIADTREVAAKKADYDKKSADYNAAQEEYKALQEVANSSSKRLAELTKEKKELSKQIADIQKERSSINLQGAISQASDTRDKYGEDSTMYKRAMLNLAEKQARDEIATRNQELAQNSLSQAQLKADKATADQKAAESALSNFDIGRINAEAEKAVAEAKKTFEEENKAAKQAVADISSAKVNTKDDEKLNKLKDAADRARETSVNASLQEKKAQEELMAAVNEVTHAEQRKTAAIQQQQSAIAQRKAAENNVGAASTKTQAARDSVTTVNTEQVAEQADKAVSTAEQNLQQATNTLERKVQALNKAKQATERAAAAVQTATKNSKSAEINVQTQKAKAKLDAIATKKEKIAKPTTATINANGNILSVLSKATIAAHGLKSALSGIAHATESLTAPGFEYAKSLESARIGIAGIYSSMTEIDGKQTTFEQGLKIANSVVDELTSAAAVTAATPTDLVRTFQGLAGPGLGEGMSTDELMKYTVTGVNAAKAFQLPADQFIQELRDMVQGGIQPASSTIATALGLKDSDIREMQNSADGLFKSLMQKMQGFDAASSAYAQTMTGKQEILKQSLVRTSAEITNTFEAEIKSFLDTVTSLFAEVDLKTGKFTINPAITDFIKELRSDLISLMTTFGDFNLDTGIFTPNEEGLEMWNAIVDCVERLKGLILDAGDLFVAWSPAIGEAFLGVTDIVKELENVAEWLIHQVTWIGKVADGFEHTREIIKTVGLLIFYSYSTIKLITAAQKIFNTILNVTKIKQKALLAIEAAQVALALLKQNIAAGLIAIVGVAAASYFGLFDTISKKISSTIDGFIEGVSNVGGSSEEDIKKIEEARDKNGKHDTETDKDLPGKAQLKGGNKKADEQAQKKALQQQQKYLSRITKQIENHLKEALDLQKEHMEKVELLYKQGKVTFEEYYREKANNDKVNAEAQLKALQEKKDAIMQVQWDEDKLDERNDQLDKIAQEMAKYNRSIDKANESLADIAQLNQAFKNEMSKRTGAANNAASNPVDASIWKDVKKVFVDYARKNDWDNPEQIVQWVLEASAREGVDAGYVMSLIQQESSGHQNQDSDTGARGLMQLMPDTASGLGVDLNDAQQNIAGGVKYLADMLRKFNGDMETALAAYNVGPGSAESGNGRGYAQSVKSIHDSNFANVTDTRTLDTQSVNPANAVKNVDSAAAGFIDDAINSAITDIKKNTRGTMHLPLAREACVQAATMIGSYYDKWLAKQVHDGVVYVPTLVKNSAEKGGPGYIPFDESKLQKGNVIVFRNPRDDNDQNHVVLYSGNGPGDYRYTGNSSSANDEKGGVVQGNDYRTIGFVPQYIIKTGEQVAGANHSINDVAATTNQSLEYKEALKKAKKTILEEKQKVAEIYGEGLNEQIQLITDKYEDKIAKANSEIPETQRNDYIQNLLMNMNQEILEANFKNINQNLEYKLKDLENSGKVMSNKVADGLVGINDAVSKYYEHFYGNNSTIKKTIDQMSSLMLTYQRQGNMKGYWEIKDRLDKIDESFISIIESWMKAIQEHNSWRINMIEADQERTTGQKEIAKEGFEQATHQSNATFYGEEITAYKRQRDTASDSIIAAQKEILALKEKIKSADSDNKKILEENLRKQEDIVDANKKLIAQIDNVKLPALEQSKALEEALGRNLTLLDKVRKSAKQSLEDGLYTFLTDSVNEAKSLEEALSDLAVTILKSIQQIFAKQITNDLINTWFPVKNYDGSTAGQQQPKDYEFHYDDKSHQVWGATTDKELGTRNVSSEIEGAIVTFDTESNRFVYSIKSFAEKAVTAMGNFVAKENSWHNSSTSSAGTAYNSSYGLAGSPLMKNDTDTGKTSDAVVYSDVWANSQAKSSTEMVEQTANTANAVNTQGAETNQQLAQANQELVQIEREMSGASEISDDLPFTSSPQEAKQATDTTVSTNNLETNKSAKVLDNQLMTSTQSLAQEKQTNQQLNSINNNLSEIKSQNKANADSNTTYSATTSGVGSAGSGQSANFSATSKNFITSAFDTQIGQFAGSMFALKSLITGDNKERLLSLLYLESQVIYTAIQEIRNYLLEIASTLLSGAYGGRSNGDTANESSANNGGATTSGATSGNVNAPNKMTGKNFITSVFDTVIGQFAGSAFAAYSLVNGDNKEQLLSLIYLELQLIYNSLTRMTLLSAGNGFATGGYISGAGTSTSDSIPAQLSNGEYVVKASSVQKYGRDMLERINNGTFSNLHVRVPHFATGGYVGSTGAKATDNFATTFGATVSPKLSVNNYVDGKRIFDTYGKDVVRNEVRNAIVKNAKFYAETLGRM